MLRTRAVDVSLWDAVLPSEVLRLPEEARPVDARLDQVPARLSSSETALPVATVRTGWAVPCRIIRTVETLTDALAAGGDRLLDRLPSVTPLASSPPGLATSGS